MLLLQMQEVCNGLSGRLETETRAARQVEMQLEQTKLSTYHVACKCRVLFNNEMRSMNVWAEYEREYTESVTAILCAHRSARENG